MSYLEELLPEFRKGAKIRLQKWKKEYYIKQENTDIKDNDGNRVYLGKDYINDDSWEFYKDPEFDWDYIIKNKCLCWFWRKNKEDSKMAGYLADYDSYNSQFGRYKGENNAVIYFDYCRPVRRDEVTFYEDKED